MEKQKVLIVDDEPRNQRIIIESLEELCELKTASSGEEALSLIETFDPDVVLLDIMMPGIDGYEVCRKIRQNPELKYTKVVLVSGKAMIEERLQGYEVGADDYMTKPFIPEELIAKTEVFLRLAKMEKELDGHRSRLDALVQARTNELLETQAKLMNATKMSALGEMAGGVAHEINTPLSTIFLLTDSSLRSLSKGSVDIAKMEKSIKTIGLASQQIGKIVKSLQFFSRDSSTDPFLETDLVDLMNNTVALCNELFKKHNVSLEVETPHIAIECRSSEISQILINLLNNARDAVQDLDEKWVRLVIEDKGDFVQFQVSNSGPKISSEIREKLFQPFFTTKEVGRGTGLGLSVSKGIAQSHGGEILLDENSINTTFLLNLPKTQTKASAA